MKLKLAKVSICLLILFSIRPTPAVANPKWNYTQTVTVNREGPVKVNIPYGTVDKLQPDFSDLRLVNSDGHIVPFYLRQEKPRKVNYQKIKTYDVARSETQTVVNLVTGVEENRIDALKLNISNRKFLKSVTVKSSNDYKYWQEIIKTAPIFGSTQGPSNNLIMLPPGKRKYLRLIINDLQSTPVKIDGIKVRVLPNAQPPTKKINIKLKKRQEVGDNTIIDLKFPYRNLPLLKLQFSVANPVFKREVALFQQIHSKGITRQKRVGEGTIFRFRGNSTSRQRLTFPVNHQFLNRQARLVINNRDNPRLELKNLTGIVPEIKLVFWARQPGTYRILAGNRAASRADYQLDWLRDYVESTQLPELLPGPLEENKYFRPPEELPELPTRGAKLIPKKWKYRKKLQLNSPGIKWLELPPAVLAHSRPHLQDLRLLGGQHQIPYILAEQPLTRTIDRTTIKISQKQQGTTTRYKFELPHPNLPLLSIFALPEEKLYKRKVVVYEKINDHPNRSNRRVLGRSTWKQHPDRNKAAERIYLRKRPLSTELYLEIYNEDNAPLKLNDFNFSYTTHRIFFKTEQQKPVFLYYGNNSATTPDYDIKLVKTSLLNSQAQQIHLGLEERLTPSAWWKVDFTGSTTRIIFWAIIIFVTAGLLIVIAYLLPEVQTEEK